MLSANAALSRTTGNRAEQYTVQFPAIKLCTIGELAVG
jgi:hypothetical protein